MHAKIHVIHMVNSAYEKQNHLNALWTWWWCKITIFSANANYSMLSKIETSLDAIHKSDETKEENPTNNSCNWTSNERQAKLKLAIALMMMLVLL